ncbi:glutamate racemase [Zunongwangia sp.]|uniref:glutamate racemase n=1 Tax=Zunongwangia sp. TaxID=1965325 RepID=UPI003AA8ABBD
MNNTGSIGIFDSGIGGTSIWREVKTLLPSEDTIYLADSKNAPYGIKSKNEIIALSRKNTEKLLELGAKLIIVACNTATTNAITELRNEYNVPFIGIEPAIKPAALLSKTKNIGILATKGTLSSALFSKTSKDYTIGLQVTEVEGNGLVELIESGRIESQELYNLLQKLISQFDKKNIDYLVLGCSHYPYLIPILQKLLPNTTIIDSGEAVARQTKTILQKKKLFSTNTELQQTSHLFFSNKSPEVLEYFIKAKKASIDYLDF